MILREAVAADAAAMVELMALPGHFTPADAVAARLGMTGLPTLVADQGGSVFGLCGLTSSTHVDRDAPVGRITIMVVAEKANALVGVGVIAQIARAKPLISKRCSGSTLRLTS